MLAFVQGNHIKNPISRFEPEYRSPGPVVASKMCEQRFGSLPSWAFCTFLIT